MQDIRVKGYGSYLPPLVVTNEDMSKLVSTSNEWIVSRTGIKERRISEGEDTSIIASKAGKLALERACISSEEIDLIIVATVSPEYFTPSVACLVQKELGAVNAMAFDINAACSGFIFGLEVAVSLMKSGSKYKKALVIGAETLSKILNWEDRSTCVLFGDGGGAVVLSKEEVKEEKLLVFHSESEGDKSDALMCSARDLVNPFIKEHDNKYNYISMDGEAVFKFATRAIISSVNKVLEESNVSLNDVDYIVPHQANCRIIDFAAKKLKVDKNKFYLNVDKVGNTSSASIPIALNEMFEKNMLTEGKKVILVGFGGGLTFGSVLIEL